MAETTTISDSVERSCPLIRQDITDLTFLARHFVTREGMSQNFENKQIKRRLTLYTEGSLPAGTHQASSSRLLENAPTE